MDNSKHMNKKENGKQREEMSTIFKVLVYIRRNKIKEIKRTTHKLTSVPFLE